MPAAPAYWPRAVHPRAGPFPRPPASRRISPETVRAARTAARKIGLEAWLFGPGPDPGATAVKTETAAPPSVTALYDELKAAETALIEARDAETAARDRAATAYSALDERVRGTQGMFGRIVDGRLHVLRFGVLKNRWGTYEFVPLALV